MTEINLSFPDSNYTIANPPSVNTLKTDLSGIELAHNAHEADTAAHSVSGEIVGTNSPQTLTNKTFTLPKVNEDVAVTATATELNFVDGVTSAIQAQLNGKQATGDYATGGGIATNTNTGDEVAATATVKGKVELATDAETITGTDTVRATTPANVQAKVTAQKDVTETLTNKTLTSPVINTGFSGTAKATGAEITTGTNDTKIVTPKALADATVGKLGSAWASWTPTFTNFTKGSATITAKYTQIGKTVHFRLAIVLAADSIMGSSPSFTLPVTSVSPEVGYQIGFAKFLDSGVSFFFGEVSWANTTTAGITALFSDQTPLRSSTITASSPFVWTTTDALYLTGTYEAA